MDPYTDTSCTCTTECLGLVERIRFIFYDRVYFVQIGMPGLLVMENAHYKISRGAYSYPVPRGIRNGHRILFILSGSVALLLFLLAIVYSFFSPVVPPQRVTAFEHAKPKINRIR